MLYPPETRFCLTCLRFNCEHKYLDLRYRPPSLNYQEVRIARLVADPSSPLNKEIAYQLGLSEGTVKIYLLQMNKRLRDAGHAVTNRTGLAAWALKYLKEPAVSEEP